MQQGGQCSKETVQPGKDTKQANRQQTNSTAREVGTLITTDMKSRARASRKSFSNPVAASIADRSIISVARVLTCKAISTGPQLSGVRAGGWAVVE